MISTSLKQSRYFNKKIRFQIKIDSQRTENSLSQELATEEILKKKEYFGQYGIIKKVIVNRDKPFQGPFKNSYSYSAYITFQNFTDASLAILSVDGFQMEENLIKASFGMTKYCSFFINNQTCSNSECLYLHKIADEGDSFSKDDNQAQKKILKVEPEEIIEYLLNSKNCYESCLKRAETVKDENEYGFPSVKEAVKKMKLYKNQHSNSEVIIKKKTGGKKGKAKQKVNITACQWGEEPQEKKQTYQMNQSLVLTNKSIKSTKIKGMLKSEEKTLDTSVDQKLEFPSLSKSMSEQCGKNETKTIEEDEQKSKSVEKQKKFDYRIQQILKEQDQFLTKMDKSILKNLQMSSQKLKRQTSRYDFVKKEAEEESTGDHIMDIINTFIHPVTDILKKDSQITTHNGYSLFEQCYTFNMSERQ